MGAFFLNDQHPTTTRWLSDEATEYTPSRHVALVESKLPNSETVWGLGAHQERSIAQHIAQCELVEHFALADASRHSVRFGSAQDHSVNPATIRALSEAQAAKSYLATFNPVGQYYWIPGRDLPNSRDIEVVAEFCIAPFDPGKYPQRVAWANSSGMAAHTELRQAQRSALLELFERDALMVTWMAQASPPHIARGQWSEMVDQTLSSIEQLGYQVHLLDLTCRSVPVVMALVHQDQWPALSVGLAARESSALAAEAAVRELEVNLLWHLTAGRTVSSSCVSWQPEDVKGIGQHEPFYAQPHNRKHASLLWASKENARRDPHAICEPLLPDRFEINHRCHQLHIDNLYQVDYGATHSLQIVRLLTPNLVPISFGYDQFPLSHPARHTVAFPYDVADPLYQNVTVPHPLD